MSTLFSDQHDRDQIISHGFVTTDKLLALLHITCCGHLCNPNKLGNSASCFSVTRMESPTKQKGMLERIKRQKGGQNSTVNIFSPNFQSKHDTTNFTTFLYVITILVYSTYSWPDLVISQEQLCSLIGFYLPPPGLIAIAGQAIYLISDQTPYSTNLEHGCPRRLAMPSMWNIKHSTTWSPSMWQRRWGEERR
jgi:hypothetical protein